MRKGETNCLWVAEWSLSVSANAGRWFATWMDASNHELASVLLQEGGSDKKSVKYASHWKKLQ